MYDVTVTNNYHWELTSGGPEVRPIPPDPIPPNGGKISYKNWGTCYINVPGMGEINFIDLGDRKLPEFTSPDIPWTESTWGGLIRYRGVDAYFRYEGQGTVEVVVDSIGGVSLHFPQGGMIVNLPDMVAT